MFPLQVLPGPVPHFPSRWTGVEQGCPAQRGPWGIVGKSGKMKKCSCPGSVAPVTSEQDTCVFIYPVSSMPLSQSECPVR